MQDEPTYPLISSSISGVNNPAELAFGRLDVNVDVNYIVN